jgi:prepilin-type N-terminal cleavage/methylation domain-containing protein
VESSRIGEGGFTLVEIVITMVLLSVGLLGLGPMMISVMQGNRFSQDMTLATSLAEDRLEEILHQPVFSTITTANFPDEAQGQIRSGDSHYVKFSRTVTIADSTDILGRILMKNVTVVVAWTGLSGRTHDVILHGKVARF